MLASTEASTHKDHIEVQESHPKDEELYRLYLCQWCARLGVPKWLLWQGFWLREVFHKQCQRKLVTKNSLLNSFKGNYLRLMRQTCLIKKVCCNSCKKPVKASQFVIHAELCKSLGSAEELLSEIDSGAGNRKPPRKERKKLIASGNQKTSSGAQERFAIVDVSETVVSSSQLLEPVGVTCLEEAKEILGKNSSSDGEMITLIKRPKLVASDTFQCPDDSQTAQGVSNIIGCVEASTYVPAPLATKVYYSQRNHRLKGAIGDMYHQASIKECGVEKKESQGNSMTCDASFPRIFSNKLFNDHSITMHLLSSPSTQNVDQTVGSSEASFFKDGCMSSDDALNQRSMADVSTSQAAAFGAVSTRYHALPFSFSGKSGTQLPPIPQPNGKVPVV